MNVIRCQEKWMQRQETNSNKSMTMGLGICTSTLEKSTAILAILKTADILLQKITLKKSTDEIKNLEVFMPQNGDSYTVKLLGIHLDWGNIPDRRTTSRPEIDGEAYIPIPIEYARRFHIYNSNKNGANTLYNVTCLNGQQISGQFLAQGCISAGDEFAKNFSVQGDLKALGAWFRSVNACVGGMSRLVLQHIMH